MASQVGEKTVISKTVVLMSCVGLVSLMNACGNPPSRK